MMTGNQPVCLKGLVLVLMVCGVLAAPAEAQGDPAAPPDRAAARPPDRGPAARPNDPGFAVVFAAHDGSFMPDEADQTVPTSSGGFMRAWAFGGQQQAVKDNYLGGIEGTGSVPADMVEVAHGPQAPHGMPFVFRHRLPAGMGSDRGTATGNGGGIDFFPSADSTPQFRKIYQHFWVIYEGHEFEGQRVLSNGGYRMSRELGGGRRTNHYNWFHSVPGAQKRHAVTGECTSVRGPDVADQYEPITHGTPSVSSLPGPVHPGPAPHCTGDMQADYSNWLTGAVRGWKVGQASNFCGSGTTARSPGCDVQVGRWHRFEVLIDLGTPDQPDGSLHFWIDGELVAHVQNVRMLSDIYEGENGIFPNQGYTRKTIWSHYHPMGNSTTPRRKPFTDFVSYADLYISGEPF